MSDDKFLSLTKEQIKILEKNGCRSDNWENVVVSAEFDPDQVSNTVFEGEVRIGSMKGTLTLPGWVECRSEIRNACLCNVTVGDNCRISQVNGRLMNLKIDDNVLIENVGTIACVGNSTFGNGYEICPLNEGGGRELKMTEKTSAQVAYLSVMYRQEKKFILEKTAALPTARVLKMFLSDLMLQSTGQPFLKMEPLYHLKRHRPLSEKGLLLRTSFFRKVRVSKTVLWCLKA